MTPDIIFYSAVALCLAVVVYALMSPVGTRKFRITYSYNGTYWNTTVVAADTSDAIDRGVRELNLQHGRCIRTPITITVIELYSVPQQ